MPTLEYQAFLDSLTIGYVPWHDGGGYHVKALAALSPEERGISPDRHSSRNVLSFLLKASDAQHTRLFVCNFTSVPHSNYGVGAPGGGFRKELTNSGASLYAGGGHGNRGEVEASLLPVRRRPGPLSVTAPPLAVVVFQREGDRR